MQAHVNVAASKKDTCIADLAERDSTCTSPEELKFGMESEFVSPTRCNSARRTVTSQVETLRFKVKTAEN